MMPHNRIHRFWFTPSKLEPPADYSGRRSKRNLQKGNRWEDCVDSDPFLGDCGTRRMAPPSACQPPPRPEDIRFQALLNERLGRPVGFLNPALYGAVQAAGGFRDITEGGNGAYSAAPGWDPCTGLGTPRGGAILDALGGAPVVGRSTRRLAPAPPDATWRG